MDLSTRLRTLLCGVALLAPAVAYSNVTRDGDKVIFDGEITKQAAAELIEQFDRGARLLVVTSQGGNAEAALAVGQHMLNHGVSVVVDRYCFSACANYLFLAGRTKSLNAASLLGFHGGPIDKIATEEQEQSEAPEALSKVAFDAANAAFYAAVHADVDLIANIHDPMKLPKNMRMLTLTADGRKYTHVFRDDASQAKFLLDFVNDKPTPDYRHIVAEWANKPIASTATYFPSKAALASHGVTGIVSYPYPKSQKAMDKLGKTIHTDLKLFGNYRTR